MTPEAMEKVKNIFAEEFNQRHAGELTFDPIIVKPDIGYYGDEYVRVLIVVDGDTDLLDSGWMVGLITRVRDKLETQGITEFPSPYLIDKAEYQYYLKRGKVDSL